jgi:hypothetical protein
VRSLLGVLGETRQRKRNPTPTPPLLPHNHPILRARYAAKLLKKPDQCRMVALCSHLFWVGPAADAQHYHDPRRVLECLQR